MGIYIPNMSKPKSCKECESFCIEFYMGENKMGSACTLNDDDGSTIEADYNSCPLIEISETKYHNMVVALDILEHEQNDCIEAERRADDNTD